MSSNVQAWRTPVSVPSGAYRSSLTEMIQTCGCACAAVAPKSNSISRARRQAMRTSGCFRLFQQAAAAQERVGLGLAPTEGDIGGLRVDRAAAGIDVVMQALGGGGIEDVAGLLER